jgi:hypothetical protein
MGHGKWGGFCKNDLKAVLGGRISSQRITHISYNIQCVISFKSALGGKISSPNQASKYMRVAENKALVLEYFRSENSINHLTSAIAGATPEQIT